MKFAMIGLLAIGSLSTYANDYEIVYTTVNCQLSAEKESISQVESIQINYLETNYLFKHTQLNGKTIKREMSKTGSQFMNIESVDVKPYWNKVDYKEHFKIKVKYSSLSAEKIREILSSNGTAAIPENVTPLKIPRHKSDSFWSHVHNIKLHKQIHFPSNVNDGLSYHINLECGAWASRENKI